MTFLAHNKNDIIMHSGCYIQVKVNACTPTYVVHAADRAHIYSRSCM